MPKKRDFRYSIARKREESKFLRFRKALKEKVLYVPDGKVCHLAIYFT